MVIKTGMPEFHIERMHSVFLHEEQKKPDSKFYREPGVFVLSKIDSLRPKPYPYQLEQHEKQVFYEFERVEKAAAHESKYHYYKIHYGVDEDFNLLATDAEMAYCQENKEHIKKARDRMKRKDDELCRTDNSHMPHVGDIKMPVPNH